MPARALALLLVGCSSSPEPAAPPDPAPELAEPTEEPRAIEVPLDPDSECGRARLCCEAYARAIAGVVAASACVGPAEVAGEPDAAARCDRMREGWRVALEHHPDEEPPEACR